MVNLFQYTTFKKTVKAADKIGRASFKACVIQGLEVLPCVFMG